ncbi:MAG: glycosyltransferase family 39 protein [Pseudomonadota bacterium]
MTARAKPKSAVRRSPAQAGDSAWLGRVLAVIAAALAARLGFNALELIPVHFDEAQYWTYGKDPALGYYSKPPLSAWMIRIATDLFGDTLFALRFWMPLVHAWIAWLIFATARRLYDAQTGFWAALGYTLAPGVTASTGLMTTDPPMMTTWAIALYALIRVMTAPSGKSAPLPWLWWAVLGLAVGAGFYGKYTILAFLGGALGYAVFSRTGRLQPRARRGPLIALIAGLALLAPHLVWLVGNSFVSVAHLAENAEQSGGLTPTGLPEFLGAQAGVIGPVFLLALAASSWPGGHRRRDWRWRILAWLTLPLFLAMCVQSLSGGANANWAAPCYVAGAILAARWLLTQRWRRGLWLQAGSGLVAAALLWGSAALYAGYANALPRLPDPYKKMRLGAIVCEAAVTAMEETGAEVILSDSRGRLAECAWAAGLSPDQIRVWNPAGRIANHYEMTASLTQADRATPMILIRLGRDAAGIAAQFATAEPIAAADATTHTDRAYPFEIWYVSGFRGYADER